MYLIVNLVFSHLGLWSGNLFLIAPILDLCLLVTFDKNKQNGGLRQLPSYNARKLPHIHVLPR